MLVSEICIYYLNYRPQEADFAVAKFTVTSLRDTVIDYTVPFWHEPAVMVMRKPEENSMVIYLGPFQTNVWYATFLAIPVMGVAIAGVTLLRATIYHGKAVWNRANIFRSVYSSIWFTYGALVQQGNSIWKTNVLTPWYSKLCL